MPEKCTCGTTLVADARFCHRCGRPTSLTPEFIADDEPPVIPVVNGSAALAGGVPPLQAKFTSVPVGFGNPVALRVAVIMSMSIMLLQMIPGLNLLFLAWWLGAGWGAVLMYKRMTGMALNVRSGAKLGSITGVLTFLGMTLISALTMVAAGKQVLDTMVQQNPEMKQVVDDPAMLASVFLIVLVLIFCLVVGVCAAGGALAARQMGRGSNPTV